MRKPRKLLAGARYHVTARANRKERIFNSDEIKELFLSVIKRAKKKYSFRLDNFCIMGNHFHIVIQPGKGMSLSAIMQWIMSVFAMSFNRLMGYVGHVWGDRFFSRIISGMRELIQIFRYIDMNPVIANQIKNPLKWKYGGLYHNRTGCHEIVDEMDAEISALFPEHHQKNSELS